MNTQARTDGFNLNKKKAVKVERAMNRVNEGASDQAMFLLKNKANKIIPTYIMVVASGMEGTILLSAGNSLVLLANMMVVAVLVYSA